MYSLGLSIPQTNLSLYAKQGGPHDITWCLKSARPDGGPERLYFDNDWDAFITDPEVPNDTLEATLDFLMELDPEDCSESPVDFSATDLTGLYSLEDCLFAYLHAGGEEEEEESLEFDIAA